MRRMNRGIGGTMSADTAKGNIKKGKKGMRYHRFFAYATVVSFLLTMYTGYKHK